MGEHIECPRCSKITLEDELCEECGCCVRCCDCGSAFFDDDELGIDTELDDG